MRIICNRRNQLKSYRSFSLESFKQFTVEKFYSVKIFFKWISFHSKKYFQEIKDEHSAGLPDPPDYVPPKRLSFKEYTLNVFFPTIQFIWKNKTRSMKVMEEEYLKMRDPKKLKEFRQKGHDFSDLEYYFGLDYEKELKEKKEEEKLREQGLQIPPKPKEIEYKLDQAQSEQQGAGDSPSFQKYFKFFVEIFFNSLRQFIIGKFKFQLTSLGYNEGMGREVKPEKYEDFKEKMFDQNLWMERVRKVASKAGDFKSEMEKVTKVNEEDLKK
jgi:hypothetical protein